MPLHRNPVQSSACTIHSLITVAAHILPTLQHCCGSLATFGLDESEVLGILVKYSTVPSKSFGNETDYGSLANISHQPPGGRDFGDVRHFLLVQTCIHHPPDHTNIIDQQMPLSATSPYLGTLASRHATG